MPETPKFCKDCQHFMAGVPKPGVQQDANATCHAPELEGERDLVTGARPYCGGMRLTAEPCGPEGRYFKAKNGVVETAQVPTTKQGPNFWFQAHQGRD